MSKITLAIFNVYTRKKTRLKQFQSFVSIIIIFLTRKYANEAETSLKLFKAVSVFCFSVLLRCKDEGYCFLYMQDTEISSFPFLRDIISFPITSSVLSND